MPWEPRGGGPWGSTGRPPTPDLESILRRGQDQLRRLFPGGPSSGKLIGFGFLVLVGLWLLSGFYKVDSSETGVELILGQVITSDAPPGLNYNLPAPIGSVYTPDVKNVKKVEIGFRTQREEMRRDIEQESLMLTGDENIIDVQFVVFWVISDAEAYLFRVRRPDEAVGNVAESAIREVIGKSDFEYARTSGRQALQQDTQELIQSILDSYGAGVLITQVEMQKVDPPTNVIDAFRDVQAARADKESIVNEAQAYVNEVIERAAGEAQKIVLGAEAYREERILNARGESSRFLALQNEYLASPEVTRRRLYLETMEQLLGSMNKILIDESDGDGESVVSGGAVPYLSLNELLSRGRVSSAEQGGQGASSP